MMRPHGFCPNEERGRIVNFRAAWMVSLLGWAILGGLLSSCTITPKPDLAVLEPVKAIPRNMGIYFSPDFKQYEFRYEGFKTTGDPGDKATFAIGAASVGLLQKVFQGLFSHTETVAKRPPPIGGTRTLDGVIEPNIEAFTLSSAKEQPRRDRRYRTRLTYRFTLYTRDGKIAVFWVSGYGSRMGRTLATDNKIYEEATDDAMKNLAKSLTAEFSNIPEVQAWIESTQRAKQN